MTKWERAGERLWSWTSYITNVGTKTREERTYRQNRLIEEMQELSPTLTTKQLASLERIITYAWAIGNGEEE